MARLTYHMAAGKRAMKRAGVENVMFFSFLYCAAALLSVVRAQSGKEEALLLPGPVHLSGIVTDIHGKPLADTWINHTGIKGQSVKTNSEGRFDIQTQAPAIVFRRDGFNGKYYRVERHGTVDIKLDPALPLRVCPSSANCFSLKGFVSAFCLPRVQGVSVAAQTNDIDYGQRLFQVQTPTGRKAVEHAAGPMWSGLPLDEDVWSAVEYIETDYRDSDGFLVIDARGKSVSGVYWRVLGRAFEKASYRNLPPREARLLDKVLDGACLLRQPSK